MIYYFFAVRKRLMIDEDTELADKVREVEEEMSKPLTIWDDEDEHDRYHRIMSLGLEERRLLIVWSLLDCSTNKVANLFKVDRKTVSSRLTEILNKVNGGQ